MGRDDSSAVVAQLTSASAAVNSSVQTSLGTNEYPQAMISADQTLPCANGGSVAVAGDLSGDLDAGATGSYSLDLMTTFADCALGTGLVVNGAPYLTTTGTLSFQAGTLTAGAIAYSGAFTASGDTCNIDVTIKLAAGAHPTFSATGTVCGSTVKVNQ